MLDEYDFSKAKRNPYMRHYDYLLVGAGLYSAVIAWYAKQAGKSCLVLERRDHIGGNVYCEEIEGINVHKYGAHIFHTSNRKVWDFVNSFVEFNRYTNSPVANYKGEIYNMPFNMNTFSRMWGISTPQEAKAIIEQQRAEITGEPKNLEEQAIALVGRDIYEKLVKGYTEKQWGAIAANFRVLSSSVFQCALLTITITLTICIRASRSEATIS